MEIWIQDMQLQLQAFVGLDRLSCKSCCSTDTKRDATSASTLYDAQSEILYDRVIPSFMNFESNTF